MNYTIISYVECYNHYGRCGENEHVDGSFSITYPANYEDMYEKLKSLYKENKDCEPTILVNGLDYLYLELNQHLEDDPNNVIYHAILDAISNAKSDAEREVKEGIERERKAREERERLAKESREKEQRERDLKQLAELQARYANEVT